eukprot:3129691-Lingulodinium_polyedra.AAC.1
MRDAVRGAARGGGMLAICNATKHATTRSKPCLSNSRAANAQRCVQKSTRRAAAPCFAQSAHFARRPPCGNNGVYF